MSTVKQDRAKLKRLVESYGKKDVLNYINHLDERFLGIGQYSADECRAIAKEQIEPLIDQANIMLNALDQIESYSEYSWYECRDTGIKHLYNIIYQFLEDARTARIAAHFVNLKSPLDAADYSYWSRRHSHLKIYKGNEYVKKVVPELVDRFNNEVVPAYREFRKERKI